MNRARWWCLAAAIAGMGTARGEPLTVAEAVRLARANAPALAASRAAAAEAGAAADESRSAFAPQAFVSTTPGYASGLPVAIAGSVPSVAGAHLREVFYDPERRIDVLRAQAAKFRADSDADTARRDVVEKTILVYARARRESAVADAARAALAAADEAAARRESLLADGRVRPVDAERSRLEAGEAKERVTEAERAREDALLELRQLIGWKPDAPIELSDDPLESIPEARAPTIAEVVAADPEIQALAVEKQLADRSAKLQRRFLAPVIAAEAQYLRLTDANGFSEFYSKFKADDWSIGLTVEIPIWTGGRFASGSARSAARATRLAEQQRAREAALAILLDRAEESARAAAARRELASRRVALARRELEDDRALEGAGRISRETLEASEKALTDSSEASARADYDLIEARIGLLRLTGRLDAALGGAAPESR